MSLSHKHNTRLTFDPDYPNIDMGQFPQFNWTEFYGDVEEAIPVGWIIFLDCPCLEVTTINVTFHLNCFCIL